MRSSQGRRKRALPVKMKYDFAALRFTEDENIADRVYWYRCDFPVTQGEGVLAPVGSHNRLQFARVERTLSATEENAPYDLRLIKCVAAKYGARKLVVGRAVCYELGGIRYDGKHFTRFKRVLFTEFPEEFSDGERAALREYGVTDIVSDFGERSGGCVLLKGRGAKSRAEEILSAVRTQEDGIWSRRLR